LTWKSIEAASFQMTGLGCYRSYILMLIEVRSANSYYNLNMESITVCMPPPSLFSPHPQGKNVSLDKSGIRQWRSYHFSIYIY